MPVVYLLTNPAMPGLVKIGFTERSIEDRLRELASAPGVPMPFECFLAVEVEGAAEVEKALHDAFADKRINARREFFELSPDRPAAVLRLFGKKALSARDVTPDKDVVDSKEEQEALNRERERRGNFRFSLVGIAPGATLHSAFNPDVTCTVIDDRTVEFRGENLSLSKSALIVAHESGRNWAAVQGPLFWTYEGRSLAEIRDERDVGVADL